MQRGALYKNHENHQSEQPILTEVRTPEYKASEISTKNRLSFLASAQKTEPPNSMPVTAD
jgi:hypothetical protein